VIAKTKAELSLIPSRLLDVSWIMELSIGRHLLPPVDVTIPSGSETINILREGRTED
jgi:hypothetical protein